MPHTKADLLLHTVRLRIATELANRRMTPAQLAAALPDVPQATLYRQINLLKEARLIEVVEETPVNGAIERTYRLTQGGGGISHEELSSISPEEHIVYFNTFTASLMETFLRYIQHTDLDKIAEDGMSYNRAVIYLTEQERADFQQAVIALLEAYMSKPPTPDRKRFTLASIVIPDERDKT